MGIKALYNEIKVMRRLGESDHCLNFYEIHETENSIYMVIEYLKGGELLRRMAQQRHYSENTTR